MSQNYKRGACIGRGSFGQVYKGEVKETGQVVALKLQDLEKAADEIDIIRREVQVMSEIYSPYVVRYYTSFIEGTTLWLVMEYMAGGSLKDILDNVGPFNEESVSLVMKSLCKGLEYIHREQKLHRDIKAANILLTSNADVKLADFGVAGQMTNTLRARNTYVGSPFWMAPEVIERSQYDQTADIWSVGITAIELLKGSPPYTDKHVYMALDLITRNDPPRLDHSFSKSAREFVSACLARSPRDRASAAELLQHPFLKKTKPSALKELLRKKNAAVANRSRDSINALLDASTDDIPIGEGQNTLAWEFDSGTDSNAGTVRIRHEDDFGHGASDDVIGSADTIIAPPQPPLTQKPEPPAQPPSKPEKSKSKKGKNASSAADGGGKSVPSQSSGLLADLCLPVLANLRGRAVEGGNQESDLASALGQLEIAFVHAELAKPGLCEMFFRELLTAATTSESPPIRELVASSLPKKLFKSKSTRR